MTELSTLQNIAVWALPVLFAITLHEAAHGWVAKQLGDPTAQMLGRLTMNPLKHIDPIGTVIVPLIMVALTSFVFGWAKPVPVTWENLRQPKRDMALVALAGPGANLLMLIFWLLVIFLAAFSANVIGAVVAQFLVYMGYAGIFINLILMLLNMLPVPPLDGSRVVSSLLPNHLAWQYNRIEPYGFIILLALLFTGVLGQILLPPIDFSMRWLDSLLFR